MELCAALRIALKACLALSSAITTQAATGGELDFFEAKVRPLLIQRCYECHSHEQKIKGGLALDSRSGWETGGDNGPVIRPGEVEKSLLIKAVRYADSELAMPPKAKLPAEEIVILEQWVKQGAVDPRATELAKKKGGIDVQRGREHWAFQPVSDPIPPNSKNAAWVLDPIDQFILAKLDAASLKPNADTDPHHWLRRVSLDLTGLPPTPAEIEAFTNDLAHSSAENRQPAFAKQVDRLLESKAFGERWARHWLDLVGYADQIGTSNSIFAEHAWRYRDYVIAAFNDDKPFDRFIREQVAGDLLAAASPQEHRENLVATGFLVLGDVEIINTDKLKMEVDLVDQQVSKVGTAFLGMTLGCVRCHDHKFDAIAQTDYYGIAGMFRSTSSTFKTPFGVWSNINRTDLPESVPEKATRLRRLAENEANIHAWEVERDGVVDEKKKAEAALTNAAKEARPPLEKQRDELATRIKTLESQIAHAQYFTPAVPQTFAVHDVEKPADMRVTIRGNPYALGDTIKRGVLSVASWGELPPIPANQSGRRQLADWLADVRNPLTARVTVNRIWQKLFGEGIVRSVDYFGVRGETPTHPELLDHLATRFVRYGWSQKQLIRSLVLSRAYRMSCTPNALAMDKDPDNRLLWRMNGRRLDAESIRDAMLAVSGKLAPSEGGPAMPLEYYENVTGLPPKGIIHPAFNLQKLRPIQDYERTVYLPVIRTTTQPGSAKLRDLFDFPQPAQITGKRPETAVPTQTLFLLNGDMLRLRAEELAKDLATTTPNALARIDRLWLRVLSRPITSAERDEATAFLESLGNKNKPEAELAAWTELGRALLASNEFLLRL